MRRAISLVAFAAVAAAAAACDKRKPPPVGPQNPMVDTADQVLFHIRTVLTDRGLLKAQLEADTAFFFDQNSRAELRTVRTTFFDNVGKKNAVLTSREGTWDTRFQRTEARKNVVVVSEDGRRLETEQLRYDTPKDQISSDSAFVLTEPTRRVEGIGFVSDPYMRNIRIAKVTGGGGPINLANPTAAPAPAPVRPPTTRPDTVANPPAGVRP